MSILPYIAQEAPDSPKASFEFGKSTVTRVFKVNTTSVAIGPEAVALAPGIPYMFSAYYFGAEFNPLMLVRRIEPERLAPGSTWWKVTVTYETPERKSSSGGGQGQGQRQGGDGDKSGMGVDNPGEYENPMLEVPELETHFETQQQPIYGCTGKGFKVPMTSATTLSMKNSLYGVTWLKVGDACVINAGTNSSLLTTITAIDETTNTVTIGSPFPQWSKFKRVTFTDRTFRPVSASNYEPFNPPPNMDASKLILSITRNEPITAPHPALSVIYQDAVNSDVFWGVGAGQVKVANITVKRETKQVLSGLVVPYLRVTYTFHFRHTWDVELLDKGTWYWDGGVINSRGNTVTVPRKKHKFVTDDGSPIDGLLDGTGHRLKDGDKPVWIVIRPYNWKPFAALNLPQSFTQVQ